jgi:hypothetical protein
MDKGNMVYINNGILFSYKEEQNPVIYSKMDDSISNEISKKDKYHLLPLIGKN